MLVALRSGPAIAFAPECPASSFQMGDREYRDKGFGDWTGFYDWLRSGAESIVGVRYWPFQETRFVVDDLSGYQYVKVPEDKSCLEIYFSADGGVDRRASDDQAFGSNRVFYSEAGGWALSFDTIDLSLRALQSILRSGAKHETLVIPGASSSATPAQVIPGKLAKHTGA